MRVNMVSELERIAVLEEHVRSLEAEVRELRDDRKRAFKTGIVLLGSALIGMGAYLLETIHK